MKALFKIFLYLFHAYALSSIANASLTTEIYEQFANKVVFISNGKNIGTGFYITKDLILTNRHVLLEDGNKTTINDLKIFAYESEELLKAKDIACSLRADICVISLEGTNFSGLQEFYKKVAKTEELKVGEQVFTIGHPKSISWTLSEGIVSSKERQDSFGVYYTQLSIPASPGNSGGPLINKKNEIVGMVTLGHPDANSIVYALSRKEIYAFTQQVFRKTTSNDIFYIYNLDKKSVVKSSMVPQTKREEPNIVEHNKTPVKQVPLHNDRYRDFSLLVGSFINPKSKYQFKDKNGEQLTYDINGSRVGFNLGARINLRKTTSKFYNFIEGEYRYLDLGTFTDKSFSTELKNHKVVGSIGFGRYIFSSVRLSWIGAIGLGVSEINESLNEIEDSRTYAGLVIKTGVNYEVRIRGGLYHVEILYNGSYYENDYEDSIDENGFVLSFGKTFKL